MTDKLTKAPRKKRATKKKKQLKGIINSGSIFIGDARFFSGDPQNYPEGIIENDPTNPFKDWDNVAATYEEDVNVDLPGSFNGDLPGRGVVIQTNMMSGSYIVKKYVDKVTGRLKKVTLTFKD